MGRDRLARGPEELRALGCRAETVMRLAPDLACAVEQVVDARLPA